MAKEIVETKAIEQVSDSLYKGVSDMINNARQEVVVIRGTIPLITRISGIIASIRYPWSIILDAI